MGHNKAGMKFYVVNIQTISIDSGWHDRLEAMERAVDMQKEGCSPGGVKVMTKPRVGSVDLDPNVDGSWVPKRSNPRGTENLDAQIRDLQEQIKFLPEHRVEKIYAQVVAGAKKNQGITDAVWDVLDEMSKVSPHALMRLGLSRGGLQDLALHPSGRGLLHRSMTEQDRSWAPKGNPGKKYSGSTQLKRGSGYTDCACRDCFDTTVSDDMRNPELCGACEEAGCDGEGECCRDDAYGVEENPRLNPEPDSPFCRYRTCTGRVVNGGQFCASHLALMRSNPEPDSAKAEKVFTMWHQKSPNNVEIFRPGVDGQDEMCCVGRAHNIVYRSGKWEKRKKNDYIHHFDSKPKVWMLRHLVEDGMACGASKDVETLLRRSKNADGQYAVANLATPLSFGLDDGTDEGSDIVIHTGSKVYGAVDQKTVIIRDPHWKLIVIQGGQMYFDERGIVK